MTQVDEAFRAPLFREAVLLLRRADATADGSAQADDIQWLLDSEVPRNAEAYLAAAGRIDHRFSRRS